MVKENNFCIIMAGGIGSRFWPLSRVKKPKQFIDVLGCGETLLQAAFRRAKCLCPVGNIYIVTADTYKGLVFENLPECVRENVLCEPQRRNTAPCIAYAAGKIAQRNKEALIMVMPSDHLILHEDNFVEQIEKGFRLAQREEVLICLGIKASYPHTGYGYIQYEDARCAEGDCGIKKVKLFTEKPEYEMAKSFVESGDFLWNAGIFVWSVTAIRNALIKYLPEVYNVLSEGEHLYDTPSEEEFIENAYAICPTISVDYGIMEKADNVYVIPSDFGWSDIGSWSSLYNESERDEDGNSVVGKNVMLYDCKECMIRVPEDRLIVVQGLERYMVVENDGVVMMCRRDEEQRINQFITDVEIEKGNEYI